MEWLKKNDFLAYIDRSREIAITPSGEKRKFVPIGALKSYLTPSNIRELLNVIIGPSNRIETENVVENFLRVFAILISIDKASYIHRFYENPSRLADSNLPFTNDHDWHKDCQPFFKEFHAKQWQFCAQEFKTDWMNDTLLNDERILPIIQIDRLKFGTDSSVYQIQLHPEYNLLVVR